MIAEDLINKTRVLVIEDDPDDFYLTEDVLKSIEGQPYRVAWSGSYERAQQTLADQHFDIALVDYQIGAKSGLDFISEVGPYYPDCPMVLLTGLRSAEIDRAAQAAGAADYLPKDSLTAELLDRTIRYTLRHAERWSLLNSILINSASGMIALDRDMTPIVWNMEALQALDLYKRFSWVSRDDVATELKRLRRGNVMPDEFRNARGHTFEVKVNDVTGVGQVIVFNDITVRAEAQAQLVRAIADANETSESKSRFLATMSHELRTPLNGILGMVQVLERSTLEQEQRNSLATIKGCGQGLLEIINDLLDLSKIEAGAMEVESVEIDFGQLVENTCNLLAPTAFEKGLELTAYVEPALWSKHLGDPLRLTQVMTNLVGNAIKFTSEGHIEVSLREVQHNDQPMVQFDVTDTGPGIAAEDHALLFQRFRQLGSTRTSRQAGTGLGLSLCREIVELFGGEIGCESEQGIGSCFWFRVPERSLHQAQARLSRRKRNDLLGLSFLLVTPEPAVREVVQTYVTDLGGQITFAATQAEALATLNETAFEHIIFDRYEEIASATDLINAVRGSKRMRRSSIWQLQSRNQETPGNPAPFDDILLRPFTKSNIAKICDRVRSAVAPSNDSTPAAPAVEKEAGPRLRILLADDNLPNRQVASAMLRSAGYRADMATDGAQAVKLAETARYDVILMDVCMPEMDGIEATRAIRQLPHGAGVPIIGLTADITSNSESACTEAGMDMHLHKPVDWDQLLGILDDLEEVDKSDLDDLPVGDVPNTGPAEQEPV